MGCSSSKQACAVAPVRRERQPKVKAASTGMHKKTKKSPRDLPNNLPSTPKQTSKKKNSSRPSWKIQRGYSSGVSSCGSESGDSGEDSLPLTGDSDGVGELQNRDRLVSDMSRHSDILALSMLRQTNASDGDLAKAVVRIETPLDTPIEAMYSGVMDGKILGTGVSGTVRLVEHRETGVKYASKCMDLGLVTTNAGLLQLRNEISIMCQLDHPNIVRIEEVYLSVNEIYIVQELCLGGDLFDRLEEQENYHYTEAQCAKMVKQMLSAVRYLHSKGIVHRDLKLENFLFSAQGADSELKMIDFGFSKLFEIGEYHCEKVGTPYTVAPEIIKGNYDEKCDMWSMGVITYLLLSGETPFGGLDGENMQLVKSNIIRAQVSFKPADVWDRVSEVGKQFTKTLLNQDPTMRPTAKEAQRCEWIQVWAKKDADEGNELNPKTVGALLEFKQASDLQKLLSEVLSFTLLPEQIVDLRKEFEKMDVHGDGEITLGSLKRVLVQNAEVGALGGLTEEEVEDIFDSLRVRKSEPKIRWHEFVAASLSQEHYDDRNLRLAFGRLDSQRKGFVTIDDLSDMLGNSTEYDALQKIWVNSLEDVKVRLDHITFDEFKALMKGQPSKPVATFNSPHLSSLLPGVPEGQDVDNLVLSDLNDPVFIVDGLPEADNIRKTHRKQRSTSFDHRILGKNGMNDGGSSIMTPPPGNRAVYRKHLEMRLTVMAASKQFDKEKAFVPTKTGGTRASLVMKRGTTGLIEAEDDDYQTRFQLAEARGGRGGRERRRNKTVSDVTGMLGKAEAE